MKDKFIITTLVFMILSVIYLHINYLEGRRTDAFRCSDAEHYFSQIDIEVDCIKIRCELNKDCNKK